ncbi:MAG: HDOD domain-containing protein [Sedimentisphaerales bacterium]|jgi:signal transduction histidine kinase/HD-like signal output (HDOD) protein
MGNMPGQNPDNSAARRIELAVGQCESISILPAVAARFLTQLSRMELTPGSLAELVESDPAITALALLFCRNKGIIIKQCDTWLLQVMENISLREIRDAVLSAKICGGLTDDAGTDFRKELSRHSLAAACCAKLLTKFISPPIDGDTAYLAALLHDIGKFLLDEVMPKSFDTLLEQARADKTSFYKVEQANLGLDHTILAKRFAQNLRLPSDIILGLWLHHSHGGIASQIPQARIAAVVELADIIVRRAGIGKSGSYDEQITPEAIAETLGLTAEQIKQVEQQLPDMVNRKAEAVGLNILKPGWAYCDALRATAGQLAADGSKIFEESTRLQSSASYFDFIKELFPKINSSISAIEMAKNYATVWQNFFHTGPVCVYLTDQLEENIAEGAIAEEQGKAKAVVLEVPLDAELIPQPMKEKFVVSDAGDNVDWLFEQCEVKFDLARTKIAPLQSAGRTVGVIIFELRHPVGNDIAERFRPAAEFGGTVLDMLGTIGSQQWYAERFAQVLSKTPDARPQTQDPASLKNYAEASKEPKTEDGAGALAEMAAGAAHELNNPLSVISGRAQLLAKSENDPDRKRILEQIQQNAGELSGIIDDLMSYANPQQPRPTETGIGQIINDAVDLTKQKKQMNQLDIKIDVAPDTPAAFVDSAQISCAISNIICNGLEAYPSGSGAIAIDVSASKTSRTVSIQVIDSGRGMDEQTLARATHPFFSARPAGRKRGMGLAHAQRLIEINHGTLSLASEPDKGTTVTIILPVARAS